MIVFRKLRYKNFLSTGNNFTELSLDRSPTTLVVGHNGAGKSTLLDALSFALFGKPHRSVNKPQLVNSINNKNCVVEVEFDIGQHNFKIIRGMKPNKFEIYQNGNMINQSAAAKDYQKYLEQNILKLNHKSFHQIVVLGSSSFIPFMQLPAHNRRAVIEDLLDIGIFSKMNQVLKEKAGKLKENIQDVTYQIDVIKEKIGIQRKYLNDITALNEEQARQKNEKILTLQKEAFDLNEANAKLSLYIEEHQDSLTQDLRITQRKYNKMAEYNGQFKQKMRTIAEEAKFFEDNDHCPTCHQELTEELKTERTEVSKDKARELADIMDKARLELNQINERLVKLEKYNENLRESQNQMNSNNRDIDRIQKEITSLEDEINKLSNTTGDAKKANDDLSAMVEDRDALTEKKLAYLEDRAYNDAASEMLKDTGIKTKIIKEYLPVMNKLINQYLQVMDFFVAFHLDENFNETIKSRHRDAFNYASFSEGEKQRIDLSLLFAWRQIARMKNSTNTNLLILDETFDSSLDHDGVDNLLKILSTFGEDNNVFVISHKGDVLDGKFRSKIEFKKEHNFSVMV